MNLGDRLRRTDWLRELQLALACSLVLVTAGLAAVVGFALAGPLVVDVPSDHVVPAGTVTGLRAGAALAEHGSVEVGIADPGAGQAVLGLLGTLPTGLVVLAMLAMLLRTVRLARRDDPFTDATVRRLRQLAGIVVGGGLLAWVGEAVARFALAGTVTDAGYGGTITLLAPLLWGLLGFGYLAAAEIVNRGRAMRAELDEVI